MKSRSTIGFAALVAAIALVAGCSNSGRVEDTKASGEAKATCTDGKTCEKQKAAGCCNSAKACPEAAKTN